MQRRKSSFYVPLEIFSFSLSPAEALVKYLKEERGMRYRDMSKYLSRDERGLWSTYNRSQKKMPERFILFPSQHYIPIEVFGNRSLSFFESAVHHVISEKEMSLAFLANLVKKSYSTVYTTYRRAKEKQEGDTLE